MRIVAVVLFLCFSFWFVSPPPACAQRVEVEVEVGPEFSSADYTSMWACTRDLQQHFPWDFAAGLPDEPGDSEAPSITLFGSYYEFPWLLDIWHLIEPGFVISMMWTAIQRL